MDNKTYPIDLMEIILRKLKYEITIRSSAAEYWTYVVFVSDEESSMEMCYESDLKNIAFYSQSPGRLSAGAYFVSIRY